MKPYRAILGLLACALPFTSYSAQELNVSDMHSHHASQFKRSPLVEKVRRATARYRDLSVALGEGWVAGTPCVTGPNAGAMGVHFVLPARIGDGLANADEPEALIYEPLPNGAMRLVGVEYIIPVDAWTSRNPNSGPPNIDGHLTNLVGAPNRYGLPSFYELHVWAWEDNPDGNFVDWNTRVSCDHQKAN